MYNFSILEFQSEYKNYLSSKKRKAYKKPTDCFTEIPMTELERKKFYEVEEQDRRLRQKEKERKEGLSNAESYEEYLSAKHAQRERDLTYLESYESLERKQLAIISFLYDNRRYFFFHCWRYLIRHHTDWFLYYSQKSIEYELITKIYPNHGEGTGEA